MEKFKESASPRDYGDFLQDRIGTYVSNRINMDRPPLEPATSYHPRDYGQAEGLYEQAIGTRGIGRTDEDLGITPGSQAATNTLETAAPVAAGSAMPGSVNAATAKIDPGFQPLADGPFKGWSPNALGNLKKSLSPLDYSQFVADRHITHIVNQLPSSTGQAPFKHEYDPTDYGQPASIPAGQGGADAGSGDASNAGLLADPASHIDAYLESIVRPLPPDHDRKMGQAFQEYLAQRGYYDNPYARMALLSGKEPPPTTWSPDLGLDARASGDGGQWNPAEQGTLYAGARGKTMSDAGGTGTQTQSGNAKITQGPGSPNWPIDQEPWAGLPNTGDPYEPPSKENKDLVDYWGRYYGIPETLYPLLYRIIQVETTNGRNVNEKGLMQVTEISREEYNKHNPFISTKDLSDPSTGIRAGVWTFRDKLNAIKNVTGAIRAYRSVKKEPTYVNKYYGYYDPSTKWMPTHTGDTQ